MVQERYVLGWVPRSSLRCLLLWKGITVSDRNTRRHEGKNREIDEVLLKVECITVLCCRPHGRGVCSPCNDVAYGLGIRKVRMDTKHGVVLYVRRVRVYLIRPPI